jgi:hypothetical protein
MYQGILYLKKQQNNATFTGIRNIFFVVHSRKAIGLCYVHYHQKAY